MELTRKEVAEPGLEEGPAGGDARRCLDCPLTFMCPSDPILSPGVSLRSRAKGRLPIPMVILPFMKHGDLHAFLLSSRIGENPFVSAWGGSGRELESPRNPGREVGLVGRAV